MEYKKFLEKKLLFEKESGFTVNESSLNNRLFPFQKACVSWALKKGSSALFEDCGLGKTAQQLEWANQICKKEKKPILILSPLAVSLQTKQEGKKFGIDVNVCASQDDVVTGINITNYEKLHKFKPKFVGIVIDESSILKAFSGKTRNQIIEFSQGIPYRLACTATPAPNDFEEIGNHAEFLGVCTRTEMLSMFFINDTANCGTWRLKGHVRDNLFWKWMSTWALMFSKPSDIGFDDNGFILPKIKYFEHIIPAIEKPKVGFFHLSGGQNLMDRKRVRQQTIESRTAKAAKIINDSKDAWVVWCGLNKESEMLSEKIEDCYEITGKQEDRVKSKLMIGFAEGKINRIVTKSKIAGRGMNWQICNKAAFVGLSDSWEDLYQAIRRIYRFGQKQQVEIHIFLEERELAILENLKRKELNARHMIKNLIQCTKEFSKQELTKNTENSKLYVARKGMVLPKWLK